MPVPITGSNGNVKVATNTVALISSWELSPARKMLNSVVFGEDWEDDAPSVGNWSVKCSGFWIGTDTNGQTALINAFLAKTQLAIELDIDGTHHWTGNAYVKEIPQKNQVDALITQDFTLQGTGALTYT